MNISPGSMVGGKYQLEKALARGGMGSVWTAHHEKLGAAVAIKFMDAALATSPEFVARFEREARIAASIESPYVVHVRDYGIDDGIPYLVMELLQGEDLKTRLRRVGRMTLPEAAGVLAQVGRALRRAHEAGLVHRDLKPGNIFLARVDDQEIAKVLDFGIVKQRGVDLIGSATRTGQTLGSPHFMSPEQARAKKDLDHRSDLWSLGVILFNAITGELPFPGDEIGEVFAKILIDPIPKATSIAPDLPPAIDAFFATALARDRTLRFQSVDDMIAALSQLAGTPPLVSTLSRLTPVASGGATAATAAAASQGTLKAATVSETSSPPAVRSSRAPMAFAIGCAALVLLGLGGAAKMRHSSAAAAAPVMASAADVTPDTRTPIVVAAPATVAPATPAVVAPAPAAAPAPVISSKKVPLAPPSPSASAAKQKAIDAKKTPAPVPAPSVVAAPPAPAPAPPDTQQDPY